MRLRLAAAAVAVLMGGAAQAGELEVQLGLGMNENAHSKFTLDNGSGGTEVYYPAWKGLSFSAPIYYDIALIYWPDSLTDWGFGLQLNHAKAYADLSDPQLSNDFSHLEFSDGMNLLTANAFHKWDWDNVRAYVGAGAGLSIPHVEVITTNNAVLPNSYTWEYQIGGPAVQVLAGMSYQLAPGWRVFGEGKISYAMNDVDLSGGGSAQTNIVSTHLRGGISFAFDDNTGW